MPIIIAPLNEELMITKVIVDDRTKKRLESLGISVNSKIIVLSHSGGNTIIYVKNGRLALDNNIATKIFVA